MLNSIKYHIMKVKITQLYHKKTIFNIFLSFFIFCKYFFNPGKFNIFFYSTFFFKNFQHFFLVGLKINYMINFQHFFFEFSGNFKNFLNKKFSYTRTRARDYFIGNYNFSSFKKLMTFLKITLENLI